MLSVLIVLNRFCKVLSITKLNLAVNGLAFLW